MTRRWLLLIAVTTILALVLAGCGGGGGGESEPTVPAGDAAAGEASFQATCSACHGPDGKGLPGLGKDLTTSEFVKGQSDQQLVEFIKQGRPIGDPANTTGVDMPPRGGNPALTDDQLLDIVAYVRTLQ